MKLFFFSLAVLWLGACASPQPKAPTTVPETEAMRTQKIEPETRSLFFGAERAYTAKNWDEAKRLYTQVKNKYPRTRAAMVSSYRMGTIFYYQEDFASATREFESFLNKHPGSDLTFDVTYNLAAAEFQLSRPERAQQYLARLRPQEIQAQGPRRAEVVYQLAAQVAASLNQYDRAVLSYAQLMQLPLDEARRNQYGEQVDQNLARISNRQELERLYQEVTESSTRGKIGSKLAANVPAVDARAIPEPGTSVGTGRPVGAGTLPSGSSVGDRSSIGVILPLTGKFAPYGRRALDGILLASGVYYRNRASDLKIHIEDSQSNPAIAAAAVETLATKHRVMGIIGPISYKEAVAVADRAQQLGVPNMSLTAKEGISERGAYLFQNALTPRIQLENLVRYCIEVKGFRRFAIVAPKDAFGDANKQEFWDLVERYGGTIVAHKTYPPESKDFQGVIRELTGLADPKLRKLEYAKLGEFVRDQKAKTGKEPRSARVPPVVDFDALFVPDSPKNVGQLAASLSYFDVSGVALLGTTEWNTPEFYKRGGRYVEGAIFPGGISLGSRNARQRDFIRLYTDAYGSTPDLLAGQAYEAMELLGQATRNASSDRNDVANLLRNVRDYDSALGTLTFDETRLARRKIPIYSLVQGGNIVEQD